ncbi:hypothetical protein [Aquimarina megaterium]|uniref:hypothetical protein n=1 Tax=Aquimarina megaterium TaxID=1443666 RepID=UPI000471BCA6|nr:hypothetical protein [Aquimarina megaterium]
MKRNLLILFLIITSNLFAQKERLDFLDWQLRKGDLNALTQIAEYFDSKTELTEYLGYHIINTNESDVAKRLVRENSMFLDSEIVIDSTITSADFKKFLKENKKNITFSNLANAFLITPFDKRKTDFEIIELTDFKWNSLNAKRNELLKLDWVRENAIDSLVDSRNPLALLKIASVLLKNRYRFDEHYDNEEVISLIQLLTNSQIAVPNESGVLSYHLEKDFYERSKINLLIFIANNYKNYKWDETIKAFTNNILSVKSVDKEKGLIEQLSNENDTIALTAFIQLTKLNPEKVVKLSDEYRRARVSKNRRLPLFPYKFLKQLVQLTNYCNQNSIDFNGSNQLKDNINRLKKKLSFVERRKLENELIQSLSLENITAFEYWSLVYSNSWSLSYSSGRILDIFYSKNWNKLIENEQYLKTYLLKSRLFDDLGIIGFCNNYLIKFIGSNKLYINSIENLHSFNSKIKTQIERATEIAKKPIVFKEKEKKSWYGNTSENIESFESSYSKIIDKQNDSTEREKEITYLLSQISYDQIGKALELIENVKFKRESSKYSFLASDFGFTHIPTIVDKGNRDDFLSNYNKLSQKELYVFYLNKVKIDFLNKDNSLNYDKIYDLLKFDINSSFVGGGGSTKDKGVYSIIKVLELTFNTTLGYPNKLCCSNNMYACNSRSRAMEWMNYLKVNKHLKNEHNEPVSFAHE